MNACPRHGWIDCLCSGPPEYRVPEYMISREPVSVFEAEAEAGS